MLITPLIVWIARAFFDGTGRWFRTLCGVLAFGAAVILLQKSMEETLHAALGMGAGHEWSVTHYLVIHLLEPLPLSVLMYGAILALILGSDSYRRYRAQCTAVDRLEQELQALGANMTHRSATVIPESTDRDRLVVRIDGDALIIPANEIDYIESDGVYIRIHRGRQTHLARERLSDVESRLDANRFYRIHRSIIVNLDRIEKMSPLFHGDHLVILRDGVRLRLSRSRRSALQQRLGLPL